MSNSKVNQIKALTQVPHDKELMTGGHFLCAGCGPSIGLKLALKALGEKTVVVNTAGCLTLLGTYPYTPLKVSWLHSAIENAGSTASGIRNALDVLGRKDVNVLVYAGDGATYDIGLQALSGMLDRKDKVIYVCYNNEIYSNTGNQWNSATPYGASTTTTPRTKKNPLGNTHIRKDITKIVSAHKVYNANASIAFPLDYMRKLQDAAARKGPTFIDLFGTCVTSWYAEPADCIKIAKMAVYTGFWPLYEINEEGMLKINFKPNSLLPVERFLEMQGRFRGMPPKEVKVLQDIVSDKWNYLLERDGKKYV